MPRSPLALLGSAILVLAACAAGAHGAGTALPPTIVIDHSIGGVAYHDRQSSVEARTGKGTLIDLGIPDVRYVDYPRHGLRLLYRRNGPTWIAMQIETRSAQYKTMLGVGIGSTRKAVRAIPGVKCYPDGDCGHIADGDPNSHGTRTTFRINKQGRVVWIALGSTSG